MNKLFNNERGFTLIEALAVLVISSIIFIFATSLIVQAMNNQERITAEAQLRDEADIMMSKLMKRIFSLKESDIKSVACDTSVIANSKPFECSTTFNTYILLQDDTKFGFEGTKVIATQGTDEYEMNTKHIELLPTYSITAKVSPYTKSGKSGYATSIIVKFEVENTAKEISKSFENEIIIIDDK